MANWQTNLQGDKVPVVAFSQCVNCKVHKGFHDAYLSVRPHVLSIIQNLKKIYPLAKIYATGHSLGGALAILAAIDLDQMGMDIAGVYTYGQPRVGNKNFAAFYDNNLPQTYRAVDNADMVPHLPPMIGGFQHSGQEVWYHPIGMYQFSLCAADSSSCSNSIPNGDLTPLDHFIAKYLKMTPNGKQVSI